ncbi:MAG: CPBP family intramembrane glutamic endopeptidase [Anaerolineae bacterium]
MFGFGRIDLPGWAIIVGLPLVYNGITLPFYWIITRSLPDFAFGAQMLSAPGLLASTLVVTFLAGPFSEELGWRGYAIDALLKDNTVVLASLILGVVWWAWHIPLFFIEGLIQYELGLFTLEHAGYIVSTVSLSIHMTWLYLRTDRSIMAAILLHFTANLVSQIVLVGADLGPVWVVLTIVMNLIITAAIILLPGGLRTAQVTAVPAASD